MTNVASIHRLEPRILLAHIGMDLSFGDAGYSPVVEQLLGVLPDGKLLVARKDVKDFVQRYRVARLNADGSLDPTYVDAGPPAEAQELYRRGAVLSGERAIVVSVSGPNGAEADFLIVRAVNLTDGAPDETWGDGGTTRIRFGFRTESMIATPDGGLLLAAAHPEEGEAYVDLLFKFGGDGRLDPNFDDDGILVLSDESERERFPRLKAAPGGGFYVLTEERLDAKIARYHDDGTLDTTFAEQGEAVLKAESGFQSFDSLAPQSNGGLVIARSYNFNESSPGDLMRLNADGTRDESFGVDGRVSFGGEDDIRTFITDAQDRIVGISGAGRLFRLTPDGQLDPTFDDDGIKFLRPPAGFTVGPFTSGVRLDAAGNLLIGLDITDFESPSQVRLTRFIQRERVVLGPDRRIYVDGAEAADTITVAPAGDEIVVTLNGQTFTFAAADVDEIVIDANEGDDRVDLTVDRRALVSGYGGNDTIRTAGGDDWIYGADGDDTIDAGGGADVVHAGFGNDSVFGGAGNDKIVDHVGHDWFSGGDGNDKIFGDWPFGFDDPFVSALAGRDTLAGNAGNDTLYGGQRGDRLAGHGGRDKLYGGGGHDRLFGGAQGDWLYGGRGADLLRGDGGNDRLYADYAAVTGALRVASTLFGGAGDDLLVARDTLLDHLFGGRGDDTAVADEDDDELAGVESIV